MQQKESIKIDFDSLNSKPHPVPVATRLKITVVESIFCEQVQHVAFHPSCCPARFSR